MHLPMPTAGPVVPDPADIEQLITPNTRAIVLISPNNPTGLEYSEAALEAIYTLASDNNAALVIDETYKDFRASKGPPHRLFSQPGWRDTLIQLWSFSKSYSLTGYRVGSIMAGAAALAQIEKVMDCVAILRIAYQPRGCAVRAATFGVMAR